MNSCKYHNKCAMDECEVTACMEDCQLYIMYQKADRTTQSPAENGHLESMEQQFDKLPRRVKKDFRKWGFR